MDKKFLYGKIGDLDLGFFLKKLIKQFCSRGGGGFPSKPPLLATPLAEIKLIPKLCDEVRQKHLNLLKLIRFQIE